MFPLFFILYLGFLYLFGGYFYRWGLFFFYRSVFYYLFWVFLFSFYFTSFSHLSRLCMVFGFFLSKFSVFIPRSFFTSYFSLQPCVPLQWFPHRETHLPHLLLILPGGLFFLSRNIPTHPPATICCLAGPSNYHKLYLICILTTYLLS
ncbi:hypothetical protein P167DRAFT_297178 [Morchella conica CCBAS932]|uniref:Uncharacterized protein n=1 Tax=Morchella conica CCBAS932 TaxID=1392247 RepID=A0A3N4KMT6_9PEZI|nr:hypothetical protein P167DRAFT_297178 [Morchella conica CCBAS932]